MSDVDELVKRMEGARDFAHSVGDGDGERLYQAAADALTAQQAEIERLREALEKKGKTQIYIDGFDAAVRVSDSYRCHVTWGPDATPDDGLREGIRGIQTVLRQSRAALTGKEAGDG